MADYIFQSHGKEQGPVSFAELTARVTAGQIAEDTPVRLSDSDQWTAAEDVPGLFRAAKKSRKVANDGAVEATKSNSSHRPAVTSNAPKKKSMPVSSGPREGIALNSSTETTVEQSRRSLSPAMLLTIAVICLTTIAAGWWMLQPHRFPQSRNSGLVRGTELSLEDMTVPAPSLLSVDIAVGVATPIPGLGAELGVSSPSLNADLTSIVYLKAAGEQDANACRLILRGVFGKIAVTPFPSMRYEERLAINE